MRKVNYDLFTEDNYHPKEEVDKGIVWMAIAWVVAMVVALSLIFIYTQE